MKTVYLSTPKDQFSDPSYPDVLQAVLRRFPPSEWRVIEPAKQGWTNDEWRKAWKELKPTIDVLVLWPRRDGSVGLGCYQEAREVELARKPVICVTSEGEFQEFRGFEPLTPAIELLPLGEARRSIINRWIARCARVK